MKDKNREVKWFLGVVILLLVVVVLGTVYLSRTGEAEAKNEAIEIAFEKATEDMGKEYDEMLADRIEIQEVIEASSRTNEISYEVILSWPKISEVYDQLYQEVIEQEVWEEASLESKINQIYEEALDRAERESLVLPEEIRLENKDRGTWEVENPEDFFFVIPKDPTENIAKDLQKMMESMEFSVDTDHLPEDSLEAEILHLLKAEGFFHDYHFDYQRSSDARTYRLWMSFNDFSETGILNVLTDERTYRSERGEINNREDLKNSVLTKIKEESKREISIHSVELREYQRPTDERFGYELYYGNAYAEDDIRNFVDSQGVFELEDFNLESLKRYYLSTQIDHIMETTEPLWMNEFDDKNPLAIAVQSEEVALLFSRRQELIFQILDLQTGEVEEEVVLREDYPQVFYSERERISPAGDNSPFYNDYVIEKDQDYYILKDHAFSDTMWIIEKGEEGLNLHSMDSLEGDYRYALHAERPLLYHDELFLVRAYEKNWEDENFTIEIKNHTRNSPEEVMFSDEDMSGGHYLSSKHGILLFYPEITTWEEDLEDPEISVGIYDFQEGKTLDHEGIPEELREAWIEDVVSIDEDRLLIITYDGDLWRLDLNDGTFHQSGLTGVVEPTYEVDNKGDVVRKVLRFYSMEEGYFHLEILKLSDGGVTMDRSMILKDEGGELQPILQVQSQMEDGRIAMRYSKEHDLFMVIGETISQEPRGMYLSLLNISYSALDDLDHFKAFDSIEELIREEYVYGLADYVETVNMTEKSFFPIHVEDFLRNSYSNSSAISYYDSENRDLLIEHSQEGYLKSFSPVESQRSDENEEQTETETEESPGTSILWAYEYLYIQQDSGIIYYQDERGMLLFDLQEFISALTQ